VSGVTSAQEGRREKVGVVVGHALAFSLGCGGGSGGPGNFGEPIPTSVPADKRLSDLTPAERDQLCTDLGQWAMSAPFLTDGCNATAWLTTSLGGLPPRSAVTRASLPSTVARLTSQPTSAACTSVQNKCPGAV
jgi:hypothetical protein